MSSNPDDTDDFISLDPSAAPPRPPAERVLVNIAALTNPGLVRPNNEDVYLTVRGYRAFETLSTNLPPGYIPTRSEEGLYGMLVADGMGGESAGEVASRLAAATLIHLVLDTPDWILKSGSWTDDAILDRIASRYREVNALLQERALAYPDLAGMGTTLTTAHNVGRDLFVGHVGDSRAYLFRSDDLIQLTRDHTCAQELADMGVISQDRVMTHHLRHVLTRVLGAPAHRMEADVQRVRLSDGDQVLLCSDGLINQVDDVNIGTVLRTAKTASDACQDLINLALASGGKDNITVVLARFRFTRES
jgi:PPM family protein phosphatase